MMSQRKLCMVGTWSTIRKRAKRTPEKIVKTTIFQFYSDPRMVLTQHPFKYVLRLSNILTILQHIFAGTGHFHQMKIPIPTDMTPSLLPQAGQYSLHKHCHQTTSTHTPTHQHTKYYNRSVLANYAPD